MQKSRRRMRSGREEVRIDPRIEVMVKIQKKSGGGRSGRGGGGGGERRSVRVDVNQELKLL